MIDWSHQDRIISKLTQVVRSGKRKPVIVSPTGSGKTHIATRIVEQARAKNSKVLFFAPRRELIYQTVEKFEKHGIHCGIVMAGENRDIFAPVQVASFDTINARAMRTNKMMMPDADIVIVDEAHLSISEARKKILAHYEGKVIIGLTATPVGANGAGLGAVYDSIVNEVTVRELMDKGVLCNARYFAPTQFDLTGVKQNKSEYVISSLEKSVDKSELIGDIYENWNRLAGDRQTIVFCVSRKHARHVCEEFVSHGVKTAYVDGETPNSDRLEILDNLRNGEIQVVVNVFVYTYGLDAPSVSCIVNAAPTKQIAKWIQQGGRGLRSHDGKEDCLIIDHTGALELHGFLDDPIPWSLDGKDIRQEKKQQDQENEKPKEIRCSSCGTVFSGMRACPNCGSELVPRSEAIPVHKAELKEIKKLAKDLTGQEKRDLYGQLKHVARERGYKNGWADNKFREKCGVWPNHYKDAPYTPASPELLSWIKSGQIRYAHRKGQ